MKPKIFIQKTIKSVLSDCLVAIKNFFAGNRFDLLHILNSDQISQ